MRAPSQGRLLGRRGSGALFQAQNNIDGVGVVVQGQIVFVVDCRKHPLERGIHTVRGKETENRAFTENCAGGHLPRGQHLGAESVADVIDSESAHAVHGAGFDGDRKAYRALDAVECGNGMNGGLHVALVVILAGDVLPVGGEVLAVGNVSGMEVRLVVKVRLTYEHVRSKLDARQFV